ncbi:MAG: flippase-like domain-containing protein [Chloroflexi bacterium]|nr:flippase-like domain-containing protein [Chloroflexota bacterium]
MNRWTRLLLQILGVLLFVILLWWAGPEPWEQVLRGKWEPILYAFLLHAHATVISAIRLKLVTEATSAQTDLPSFAQFYAINILSRALGIVLPRNLSGVGGKAAGLNRLGLSLRRSLWIVMLDNLFDIFVLTALGLPAFLFLTRVIGLSVFILLSIAALIILAALFWWGTNPQRAAFLLDKLTRIKWLSEKLKLTEIETGSLLPPQKTSLAALGWSILLNLTLAFSFYFMGQAVSLEADWSAFLASYPLAQLSLIIALAPGGLGIFDLGWLGLLQLSGLPEPSALTFVVAQRAYVTIYVLILAGVGMLISMVAPIKKPTDSERRL